MIITKQAFNKGVNFYVPLDVQNDLDNFIVIWFRYTNMNFIELSIMNHKIKDTASYNHSKFQFHLVYYEILSSHLMFVEKIQ